MASIDNNAFEIERRFIQLKYNTNMPGGGTLGYDGDPNSVTNGANAGETLVYNVAQGATFLRSNGELWFKQSLPNTWIQLGGATSVASNVVTKTITAGNTEQFFSLDLANNQNFEFTVNTEHGGQTSLSKIAALYNDPDMTSNEYSFLGAEFSMDISITDNAGNCIFEITNNEASDMTCSVKVEAFSAL